MFNVLIFSVFLDMQLEIIYSQHLFSYQDILLLCCRSLIIVFLLLYIAALLENQNVVV